MTRPAVLMPVNAGTATTLLPLDEVVGAGRHFRLLPLWRHAVALIALFVVAAFAVSVRLQVQELRKDIDRMNRAEHEAEVLNERLHLEMDARRRATAMEQIATRMDLGSDARVVRISGTP